MAKKQEGNQLGALHTLLVTSYVKMMKDGIDDPRILKEIRELLRDNDITGDITDTLRAITDQSMVEVPDDMDWGIVKNG